MDNRNPERAFDHLAQLYDGYRSEYPERLLLALRALVLAEAWREHDPRVVLLDVGSGTGISTRLLRKVFGPDPLIVGMEPNHEMRNQAVARESPRSSVRFVAALGEDLPFRDQRLRLVLAAQAVQWFQRPLFFAAARRVLEPGGTLGILQNNRRWQESDFLDAYEAFLEEFSPGYSRSYRDFDVAAEMAGMPGLESIPPVFESWRRQMSLEEFVGMSLSSTKANAIVELRGSAWFVENLQELVHRFMDRSLRVEIPYRSELYMARKL